MKKELAVITDDKLCILTNESMNSIIGGYGPTGQIQSMKDLYSDNEEE